MASSSRTYRDETDVRQVHAVLYHSPDLKKNSDRVWKKTGDLEAHNYPTKLPRIQSCCFIHGGASTACPLKTPSDQSRNQCSDPNEFEVEWSLIWLITEKSLIATLHPQNQQKSPKNSGFPRPESPIPKIHFRCHMHWYRITWSIPMGMAPNWSRLPMWRWRFNMTKHVPTWFFVP